MVNQQFRATVRACPYCGATLVAERDLLRCPEHGFFFVYGPALVVRAPRQDEALPAPPMPWEHQQRNRPS
jgi:hypothetical protein